MLDLGTGWIHAYGLAAALIREADQIDLFDVQDLRHWDSFQATMEAVIAEILGSTLPEDVKQRAVRCAKDIQSANSFEAASRIVSTLQEVGFEIVSVETHDCTMQRCGVHPDHHWQSVADIQAVRLFLRASKPDAPIEPALS